MARGFFDRECDKCHRMYGWLGSLADMPKCPECGYRPDAESLEDIEAKMDIDIERINKEADEQEKKDWANRSMEQFIAYRDGVMYQRKHGCEMNPMQDMRDNPYTPKALGLSFEETKEQCLSRWWLWGRADERTGVHRLCDVPPEGWYCSRDRGHDGPCSAHPEGKE